MRRLLPLIFFIAASSALAKTDKVRDVPPPPPLSDIPKENMSSSATPEKSIIPTAEKGKSILADTIAPPHPDITVITKADVTVEEYRFNGQLYMMKVIPKMGKPYYLYDEEGKGTLIRRDDTHTHIAPPRWTIFRW